MRHNSRGKLGLLLVLALLLALGLAACGGDDDKQDEDAGSLTILDPWVRPTMTGDAAGEGDMGGMVTGAFMHVENRSDKDEKLISVSVSPDVATTVELHETTLDENDVMQMRPVEGGIDVPAGGNLVLKPGSFHIMLLDVQKALEVGDTVDLTLKFESGTEINVTATVREQDGAE